LACETTVPGDISLKCAAYKSAYLLTSGDGVWDEK